MHKLNISRCIILLSLLTSASPWVYAVMPAYSSEGDSSEDDSLGELEEAMNRAPGPQDDEAVNQLAGELEASAQLNDAELLYQVDPDFFEHPAYYHEALSPAAQTSTQVQSPESAPHPLRELKGTPHRRKTTQAAQFKNSPPKIYRSYKTTGVDRHAHQIHTNLELWTAMSQLPSKQLSDSQWVQITHTLENAKKEDRIIIERLLAAAGGDKQSFYKSFHPDDEHVAGWLRENLWTQIVAILSNANSDETASMPQKRTSSQASEDSDAENQVLNSPLKQIRKPLSHGATQSSSSHSKYPSLKVHKGNIAAKAKPLMRKGSSESEGAPKRRKDDANN